MSRVYAQYSQQEKDGFYYQQIAATTAMRTDIRNQQVTIEYLNACLNRAFDLLERAEKGKPFKRGFAKLKKGML